MNLREALINMGPSLALHRAASDEIAMLDHQLALYRSHVEVVADTALAGLRALADAAHDPEEQVRKAHWYLHAVLGTVSHLLPPEYLARRPEPSDPQWQ